MHQKSRLLLKILRLSQLKLKVELIVKVKQFLQFYLKLLKTRKQYFFRYSQLTEVFRKLQQLSIAVSLFFERIQRQILSHRLTCAPRSVFLKSPILFYVFCVHLKRAFENVNFKCTIRGHSYVTSSVQVGGRGVGSLMTVDDAGRVKSNDNVIFQTNMEKN